MREPVLSARDVRVTFGGVVAVGGVDFDVAPAEIVGLIGPNGAGKTTLLDAMSGFVSLESGRVHLDGREITRLLPYQRARLGLARSFQDAKLFPTMTVREVLVSTFHPSHATGLFSEGLRLARARAEEAAALDAAMGLLDVVDLEPYLDHCVAELSFGTTRALELAWVAARGPRVLLLDEPASGLQQSEVRVLGSLIRRIRGEAAVVIIDHDVPFVAGIADRLVAMDLGRVVAAGEPGDVLGDPAVLDSYLGTGAGATP